MDDLTHIGIKRRSGRYPWGSGGELLATSNKLAAQGLSEVEIAEGLGVSTGELRNQRAIAAAEAKEDIRLNVIRQRDGGMSVSAISREFGIPRTTVRDLLKDNANIKYRIIKQIADLLRGLISKESFVDVGDGSEIFMEVSRTKLENALALLGNEGYPIYYLKTEQLRSPGKYTRVMVIGSPGSTYKEAFEMRDRIAIPNFIVKDDGRAFLLPDKIRNVDSSRIKVQYNSPKDGLIELRAGVPDLSLGDAHYAQVRIGVDGTHFMKGMAISRDDLPKGVDIVYHSSKSPTDNKLNAMKSQVGEGSASVFGAIVKPNFYKDADGNEVPGVLHIVGDTKPNVEGNWSEWNRTIASQVLSKQSPRIAKKQLDISVENAKAELEEIMSLTHPTVRQYLLLDAGDKFDRHAVDLKAAALPRQTTNVLLPDDKIKPTEIFAPNYKNGERVVLIRYPHASISEIPSLVVNNKTSEYRKIIGPTAPDAVVVHPDVAKKLSGADFDGDTVLVIPNRDGSIRTKPTLEGLKDFEPRTAYPHYPGMKLLEEEGKQRQMGDITNLITDMSIKGASDAELAAAIRHSMVVIDAVNHKLNYQASARDNGIANLKKKYQGAPNAGAVTLVSRAKSQERVPERRDHYAIDPKTGEKVYSYTEATYTDKKGVIRPKMQISKKMLEYDPYDPEMNSGTIIEGVYADYASKMKGLGNKARLESLKATPVDYSPDARKTYATEVASLERKYKAAAMHRPLERKALLIGNEIYQAKLAANPNMSKRDKKKNKARSLVAARARLDSSKPTITITPREWEAIEMGAISSTRLKGILRNADMDAVRALATPRAIKSGLSPGKLTRAKSLINSGYTAAEIAAALGVPVNQIRDIEK